MRIALTEQVQRDIRALAAEQRNGVFETILLIQKLFGNPHLHSGLGLRKLSPRGVWEVRVGLGLRIVFDLQGDTATLLRAATHDEVRRFLRTL